MPAAPLPPALSTWIDLLRLGAAGVVFLGHAGTQRISGGLFYQAGPYGETAVDVFFVLSGFVIAHAATRQGAAAYAIARAARIWSVMLPCLALGWLMDATGPLMDPATYARAPHFSGPADALSLASSALFLDHVWFRAAQPGSNLPFWSLAFEAWYYLAFGLLAFARPPWNWLGAAAAMALAGPKIALLFPLWLLGVVTQRLCARGRMSAAAAYPLLLAPLVLLLSDPQSRACFPYTAFTGEAECLRDLGQDYGVGLLVAAHLLGVHALSPRLWPWLRPAAPAIAWLAGASFTLYLLQYPLIHFIAAAAPWPEAHWANRVMVFTLPPLVALAVAEATERRRHAWRRAIAALAGQRRQPAKAP